jgi:hypothetical protein
MALIHENKRQKQEEINLRTIIYIQSKLIDILIPYVTNKEVLERIKTFEKKIKELKDEK